MDIVFYSSIFFSDCDFSLIREYQEKGLNVTYFIQIVDGRQCGGLLDLRSYKFPPGIYPALNFKEMKVYEDYINLSNVYFVWRNPNLKDLKNWKVYWRLTQMIRKINPHVVHIAGELGVSESLLYSFRKKMVQTVHDPFMHSGEESRLAEIKRRISFRIVRKLVLLNGKQKNDFIKEYGVPSCNTYINRLGVYTALSYLSARQQKNDVSKEKYILFFGHISPYKGIDTLCEAMKKIHEVIPDLKCVIAGKGDLYFDYSAYKDCDYIILKNHFIATVELVSLIENSVFTVCPYKDATQSGVVSSSFALAKPVLATNVGGLGESVLDGITGRLISPNNSDILSQAIVDMMQHEDLLISYSKNIKTIFWEGNKSWSAIADKYIQIYETKA